MQQAITALVAILAACALAAPTPDIKALAKRHHTFRANAPSRWGNRQRSPRKELVHAYEKYGWQIIVLNPDDFGSLFGAPEASSAAPLPISTTISTTFAPVTSSVVPTSSAAATTQASSAEAAKAATTASTAAPAATSASSGDTGEVAANPEENESEYLSPVSIGGQKLNLDFDTGSADLWVFSSLMPSSESSGHSVFTPSQSSTWQEYEGGSWEISYGDGSSASGTVGFDTVVIGGATATRQAVEVATEVSGSFEDDANNDGLVGLGFSTINTVEPQQQKTFWENIKDDLAQPLFTANLRDDAAGTYTFGEIDSTEYTGDIHYVDIDNSQGFWQFSTTSYSVAGTSADCETCSPAIADTGTSLMLIDDEMVTAFYDQVNGAEYSSYQGGYTYPCDANLPNFGYKVGSYMATIPGKDTTFAELGDGTCFGGIQSNQGQGITILGDVFLKNFLAVFDGGKLRFGLAEQS